LNNEHATYVSENINMNIKYISDITNRCQGGDHVACHLRLYLQFSSDTA
jgi:hypothetical protein